MSSGNYAVANQHGTAWGSKNERSKSELPRNVIARSIRQVRYSSEGLRWSRHGHCNKKGREAVTTLVRELKMLMMRTQKMHHAGITGEATTSRRKPSVFVHRFSAGVDRTVSCYRDTCEMKT